MECFVVNGGRRLSGQLRVQGSKNSALPILAATVLIKGKSIIHNCPRLSDIECTIKILKALGCKVYRDLDTIVVDSADVNSYTIPDSLMREMRSSIVFLGAILARMGKAVVSNPGGCEIGLRPIDLHLYAMRRLGAEIDESYGKLNCEAKNYLNGSKITFSFPSVGATENAVLASCTAKGNTTIVNAAREPEIIDLCNFLNACGAKIKGAGESVIYIEGVDALHATEHSVICDRVVASTFLVGSAVTGGDVELLNTNPSHLSSVIPLLEEAGCSVRVRCKSIRISSPVTLKRIDKIITQPYPGFPTDSQALFTTLCSVAKGTSVIVENIFESRFNHVPELLRMGAKIKTEGRVAVIEGVPRLFAGNVVSPDLRGGAALVLAGLVAEGKTQVDNICYIDRGYEELENNLSALNADICRMDKGNAEKRNKCIP